jgi:methyl-accepting chemotaxis protein
MKLRFTISAKLVALGTIALVFVLAVGTTGLLATRWLVGTSEEVVAGGVALQHQMEAGQAHATLRSDVLAALDLGMRYDLERRKAIAGKAVEHAQILRSRLDALEGMALAPAVRAALQQARPGAEAYARRTLEVISLAFSDLPAALAGMDDFNKSFQQVDKDMEALNREIQQAARVTQADGARSAQRATTAIAAVMAASGLVLPRRSPPAT